MNPELQRIRIAEACGYKDVTTRITEETFKVITGFKNHNFDEEIPNYLNDLNAMHEAEQWLYKASISPINKGGLTTEWNGEQKTAWVVYVYHLRRITNPHPSGYPTHHDEWVKVHATAAQKAEAFLKTLGLWKEES
jgi:hypothetical protein